MLILVMVFAFGINSAAAANYSTQSYDVNISVSETNKYTITETITVTYLAAQRGIYRYIPTMGLMTLEDNSQKSFYATVSNVSVPGYSYSISREEGNVIVRIGDPDTWITGTHTYTISYDLQVEKDPGKDFDVMYINAVPNDWKSSIDKANVTVQFPKSFDASKVQVFAGSGYYVDEDAVEYSIKGNTIYCSANRSLDYGEGITIYTSLPEGYFESALTTRKMIDIALIAASIVVGIIIVVIFLRFGRDKALVAPVEFTAPDGINPAETGFIADGSADNKDITALIIYWADKGYLHIDESVQNQVRLIKIQELPMDAKEYEHLLFNRIFQHGNDVALSSLNEKLYTTVSKSKNMLQNEMHPKTYNKKSSSMKSLSIILITILMFVLNMRFWFLLNQEFVMAIFFFGVTYALYLAGYVILNKAVLRKGVMSKGSVTALSIAAYVLLGLSVVVAGLISYSFGFDNFGVTYFVMGLAALTAPLIANTTQFTEYGHTMTGRVKGFKNFIELAEKDRIMQLVQEDPSYFYHVLPYAYVLGVTDVWSRQFEGVSMPAPMWYTGYGNYYSYGYFNTMLFMNSLNRSMNSIQSTAISTPKSSGSSSGGFSGGSFGGGSGGGFGGGGGGSW